MAAWQMNVHSKSYPHITTLAKPGAVRLPNTLHEHFVADPKGATSFKQYREDRIWDVLNSPARIHEQAGGISFVTASMPAHEAMSHVGANRARWNHGGQVKLLSGTVIKEWAPTK